MVKVNIDGKEIELQMDEKAIVSLVEENGGTKIDVEFKKFEQLALDPLTIGIAIVGFGTYVWYRLTHEKIIELNYVK